MVDPLMAHRLGDLIKKLKHQLNLTSVVVTHDVALAKKLADRLVFLHEGRVVFFGTVAGDGALRNRYRATVPAAGQRKTARPRQRAAGRELVNVALPACWRVAQVCAFRVMVTDADFLAHTWEQARNALPATTVVGDPRYAPLRCFEMCRPTGAYPGHQPAVLVLKQRLPGTREPSPLSNQPFCLPLAKGGAVPSARKL